MGLKKKVKAIANDLATRRGKTILIAKTSLNKMAFIGFDSPIKAGYLSCETARCQSRITCGTEPNGSNRIYSDACLLRKLYLCFGVGGYLRYSDCQECARSACDRQPHNFSLTHQTTVN